MSRISLAILAVLCLWACSEARRRPNIIILMTDDQGFADVEWSGHPWAPRTPNLRKLKKAGVELMNYIAQPKCTAARGAMMTGRFPYKIGIATNHVFGRNKNTTLDLSLKIMPQYMKDLGYRTHAVGKWHLGFCAKAATPTGRGFDTFYGTYDNVKDFYYHRNEQGYDWTFDNADDDTFTPQFSANGTYNSYLVSRRIKQIIIEHATDTRMSKKPFFIYGNYLQPHTPSEAPPEFVNKPECQRIPDPLRRIQCGMIGAVDSSVGKIMYQLKVNGMLDNTVVLFTSDNGAAYNAANSAWPYRGHKQTVYEGGVKVRTLLKAPNWVRDEMVGQTYHGLVHITDWLPTFYTLGGGDPANLLKENKNNPIDGMDQFKAIQRNRTTERMWLPINIDSDRILEALRYENVATDQSFKLVRWETEDTLPGWPEDPRDPETLTEKTKMRGRYPQPPQDPSDGKRWRLFDLKTNPYELEPCNHPEAKIKGPCTETDAAQDYPEIYEMMKEKLGEMVKDEVPYSTQSQLSLYGPGRPKVTGGYYSHGDCECNVYYAKDEVCPAEVVALQTGKKSDLMRA